MRCPSCRGMMTKGKTNLPYELGRDRIVVVKDVPAWVCDQCGEVFVEMEIAQKVESIVKAPERSGTMLGFLRYEEAA